MTRVERLERQQAALEAERKRVNKALASARRHETAKANQERRAQEQAEAMAFMAYCRAKHIDINGEQVTVYDYVQGLIAQDTPKGE